MKKILTVFLLLISSAALAGSGSGNVSNVVGLGALNTAPPISFVSTSSLSAVQGAIFTLYAGSSVANTGGHFNPFYKNGVAYQVSAGKTAYCFNFMAGSGGAGFEPFVLMSATATFAFDAASVTGGVNQIPTGYPLVTGTTTQMTPLAGTYSFTGSTWPGIEVNTANSYLVQMTCYEQ